MPFFWWLYLHWSLLRIHRELFTTTLTDFWPYQRLYCCQVLSFCCLFVLSCSKSKNVSLKGAFYYINHHNSGNSFGLQMLMARHFQASWGRKELYTSKESPIICCLKKSFKTGRISVMKGSRRVLVKVVLFQLRGRGHPQDDAMPHFFADSKRPI